ncbi:transposase [Umezawaea sp. Da 62-37]|uniref:transposase n=1 Tax=Umezawaea sp. Da 62-37 TaxID=3075927 RepID=UPI0028F724F3|nr:transposase [Umezawaea sp. Da 62-37]WNV83882.1 transposase [Umezawaea sp. Da 62-37]
MIRALPDLDIATVTVLGVDDFALRRGHHCGTVLIDMDTHQPVDVLLDREAATFAAWLAEHPGTTVVCRDRAGAYAEGARTGTRDAIQVADRWHLWHNLTGYVDKTVAAHHRCLREPHISPEAPVEVEVVDLAQTAEVAHAERAEQSALVVRTKDRYEAVQALKAQGLGIKTIKRELGLAKETVRRFYRAASVEELLAKPRAGRPSKLDEYKCYLHQRWNDGCTNVLQLHREITAAGYRGHTARCGTTSPPSVLCEPHHRRKQGGHQCRCRLGHRWSVRGRRGIRRPRLPVTRSAASPPAPWSHQPPHQ